MKYIHAIFILFLINALSTVRAQERLSLSECYQLARENYPQIHQLGLINQSEQYKLGNIGKGWLPQLAIKAEATFQSDVTKLPFDEKQFSSLIPEGNIPILNKDQYRVVAQLDQTIWDGGKIRASKALTHAQARAQREQVESELYTLRKRVNDLFFGCLLQEELIGQNIILQKDLRNNIERVRSMITNGVANQSDLESLQVELLNAHQQEIELRAEQKAFREMLGLFLHKDLDEKTIFSLPELPEQLGNAAVNRPELRVLTAKNDILQNQRRLLNAGLMPRFSAFLQGGYGRPALDMLSNDFEGYYVAGIRVSWNFGKLYTLKNERKGIQANQKMIDRQKQTFLFNTDLQLIQQQTEIEKMKKLMKADEEIIRLRTSIQKSAEVKLENGMIAVTDLIREINAADLSRQKATMHHIQHLMNVYNLLYITNRE